MPTSPTAAAAGCSETFSNPSRSAARSHRLRPRPRRWFSEAPVLIVMHGRARNGATYRGLDPRIRHAGSSRCPSSPRRSIPPRKLQLRRHDDTRGSIAALSGCSADQRIFDDLRLRSATAARISRFGHSPADRSCTG
jgi:hypothetical protein